MATLGFGLYFYSFVNLLVSNRFKSKVTELKGLNACKCDKPEGGIGDFPAKNCRVTENAPELCKASHEAYVIVQAFFLSHGIRNGAYASPESRSRRQCARVSPSGMASGMASGMVHAFPVSFKEGARQTPVAAPVLPYYPIPRGIIHTRVVYRVLVWAGMNAATPLGSGGAL